MPGANDSFANAASRCRTVCTTYRRTYTGKGVCRSASRRGRQSSCSSVLRSHTLPLGRSTCPQRCLIRGLRRSGMNRQVGCVGLHSAWWLDPAERHADQSCPRIQLNCLEELDPRQWAYLLNGWLLDSNPIHSHLKMLCRMKARVLAQYGSHELVVTDSYSDESGFCSW